MTPQYQAAANRDNYRSGGCVSSSSAGAVKPAAAKHDDAQTDKLHQRGSNGGPPTLRCFLVEDSPVIRQNLVAMLEEMLPLEVLATAEDEPEAIDWMRRFGERCDLVIIDIFLRSGTGLEVLRQSARFTPHAKRVVVTNYATADIRKRCLALGADRVFDKSAEVDELVAYGENLASARLI